jgi:NDP-sugar pyrophosphorylase family protein
VDPTETLERCVVGPYVTVGPHSRIIDSVISDSIVGADVELSAQLIRDSVIGNNVMLQGRPTSYNIADHSWTHFVDDLEVDG